MFTLQLVTVLAGCALGVAAASTRSSSTPGSSTPSPELGNLFAVYPGWGIGGITQILDIQNITEEGCMQACSLTYDYFPYGTPVTTPPTVPICVRFTTVELNTVEIFPDRVTSFGLIGGCGTRTHDLPLGSCASVMIRADFCAAEREAN
ncbi:hypothetical protein B0H19DRAFT_1225821 [Mycena capillaripes]|nr:hypothetical protein B0H19DRAFT_1225821 [Mycena capillaripes]